MASSGSRPLAAPMLSKRCPGSSVPGIGQVTAGWEMRYFRANCAQEVQSNSDAHSGRILSATVPKMLPRRKRYLRAALPHPYIVTCTLPSRSVSLAFSR